MNSPQKTSIATLLTIGLVACVSNSPVDEAAVTDIELPPVERPDPVVGTTWQMKDLKTGEDMTLTLVSADGATLNYARSDGCRYTDAANALSPFDASVTWENCGGGNPDWLSGTVAVNSPSGSLWPLQVGNEASTSGSMTSAVTGETITYRRSCSIPEAVRIDHGGTPIDTYKITCTNRYGGSYYDNWTWYWAPDKGVVRQVWDSNGRIVEDFLILGVQVPEA